MNSLTVTTLRDLIATQGASAYHGEAISQLEHAFQSYYFAKEAGADDELCIAAFLHDIGHLVADERHEFGAQKHDKTGADWLRSHGFSERVAAIAENHVLAKRYLCLKEHGYFEKLSRASVESLKIQGGIMTAKEAILFEQTPYFEDIVKVRLWDELAKEVDFIRPDIENILAAITQYLSSDINK